MSERDDALTERLKHAVATYEAMSPLNKALHDAEQRRSFVRGQSGRDPGPDVLAEEVRSLRARLSSAEAERDRLREGLERIKALRIRVNTFSCAQISFELAQDFARALLTPQAETK